MLIDTLMKGARRNMSRNFVYELMNLLRKEGIHKLGGFSAFGVPIVITIEPMVNRTLVVSHGAIGEEMIVFRKQLPNVGWVVIEDNLEAQQISESLFQEPSVVPQPAEGQ